MSFIILPGSNVNNIYKAKAITVNLVETQLYFTYTGRIGKINMVGSGGAGDITRIIIS